MALLAPLARKQIGRRASMGTTHAPQPSEIPAHVPRELVRPIGLTEGPEFLAAPHAFMAGLHETQPRIFFSASQHIRGAWMLTHYEDAYYVLRHPEIFTTAGATPFPR